jgi:hypothetical protein
VQVTGPRVDGGIGVVVSMVSKSPSQAGWASSTTGTFQIGFQFFFLCVDSSSQVVVFASAFPLKFSGIIPRSNKYSNSYESLSTLDERFIGRIWTYVLFSAENF